MAADPIEQAMDASEVAGEAMLLAALIFLWGAMSLPLVPLHPFGVPNAAQVVLAGAAFAYFFSTRARPRYTVAVAFVTLAIVYTLTFLRWRAWNWCGLGRPMEAFTVPHLAAITMALAGPRSLWLRIALVFAFTAEAELVWLLARHYGQQALVPRSIGVFTLYFAALGVALAVLRERRRGLARRHVRVEAELEALRRVGPLFADVRGELARSLEAVGQATTAAHVAPRAAERIGRALERLHAVNGRLDELMRAADNIEAHRESDRALLDRDAQFGATLFSAIIVVMAGVTALIAWPGPRLIMVGVSGLALVMLTWLWATRRQPSERRAIAVIVSVWLVIVSITTFAQARYVAAGEPFVPFIGHKLFLLILGISAVGRRWLGLALVIATVVMAFVTYFASDMHQHRDLIVRAEPGVVLVYGVIAVATLAMRDQRRIASLQLRRFEAESQALHRRAQLLLALRDRLGSPLQTLVLAAEHLDDGNGGAAAAHDGVASLVALSRRLAEVERLVPPNTQPVSLDADEELRPQL